MKLPIEEKLERCKNLLYKFENIQLESWYDEKDLRNLIEQIKDDSWKILADITD